MKKLIAGLLLFSICVSAVHAQSFTQGNLVILRQGDATQTLANTGNTVYLDQYTTNGVLVSSLAIPDSGAQALIQSGTASSEGQLTRSPDGHWLGLGGYNTSRPFTNSLSGASSTAVPRIGAFVNQLGQITIKTTKTAVFSGNNIRAAVTDGSHFWVGGASSSSSYGAYCLGDTSSVGLSSTVYNVRAMNIFNGNLYVSTQTGTNTRGIWGFSGTPTTAATPTQIIATGDKSNPVDFAMNPAGTVLYVADDSNSAGVQRWDNNGTSWVLSYTFTTGYGARSLAVDFTVPNPVIYTIAGGSTNRLLRFIDAGASSAGAALITPASGTAFRGVKFAPTMAFDNTLTAPTALAPTGIITNAEPVFHWAPVTGAVGYNVSLTLPSGVVKSLQVQGTTNLPLSFDLRNASYSWTVAPFSANGDGPTASAGFTVQLPVVRFALICDNQSDKISDTYPMYANNSISDELLFLVQQIAAEPVDFVLFGGDLIASKDLDTNTISALTTRLDAWKVAMAPVFNAGIPVYPVRGNHDAVYYGGPPDSPALASAAATIWKREFPQLTNFSGPASELGFSYTFVQNGVRVIALDDYVNPGFDNTNWVKTVLATNTAKRTFVLKHQPIWTDADKRCPADSSDADQLVSVFDKGFVSAVLCGHVHEYDRLVPSSHLFQQIVNGKSGSPTTTVTYTPPAGWMEIQDLNTNFAYAVFTVQGTNVGMVWKRFDSLSDTAPVIGDSYTNNVALGTPGSLSPSAAVISQSQPTLTWSAVDGAQGYTLTITYPNRTTTSWYVFGATKWTAPAKMTNGLYSWTVTPVDSSWLGTTASGRFVVQTTVPMLRAAKSGTNVLVSWPLDTAPATLLTAQDPGAVWSPVSQATVPTNGVNRVTIPITSQPQYYLLQISP